MSNSDNARSLESTVTHLQRVKDDIDKAFPAKQDPFFSQFDFPTELIPPEESTFNEIARVVDSYFKRFKVLSRSRKVKLAKHISNVSYISTLNLYLKSENTVKYYLDLIPSGKLCEFEFIAGCEKRSFKYNKYEPQVSAVKNLFDATIDYARDAENLIGLINQSDDANSSTYLSSFKTKKFISHIKKNYEVGFGIAVALNSMP